MCSLHEFKAAVYLNNTGINLLKNCCYRQGMETLADVVAIMTKNAGSCTFENSGLSLHGKGPIDIEDKLQIATKRLSNPRPSPEKMPSWKRVRVVSDNDSVLEATGKPMSSHEDLILIRIEPMDCEECHRKNLAVTCSIVLYNYAIAFACLSSLSTSAPFTEKVDAGAFQILLMANTAAALNKEMCTNVWSPWNPALLMKWLILCQMVDLAGKDERLARQHEELAKQLNRVDAEIKATCDLEAKMSAPASRAA